LDLSTTRPVHKDDVEYICKLKDDVYRNRWITFAYWNISQRLQGLIGDNASWCTFSTWSSRTIGESLRLDKATRRIDELKDDEEVSAPGHPSLLKLRYWVTTRARGAAQLALALGNRLIFHEIGYSVVELLDWVDDHPNFDLDAWQAYRTENLEAHESDRLFPPAEEEQLWTGLDCYYKASDARDEKIKAELVLQGNVLLGAYEQERADPMLKVALEPFPGRFVRVVKPVPHVPETLSLPPYRVPWSLQHSSWFLRPVSEQFGTFMTRRVMTLDAPLFKEKIRPLRLGRGIPGPDNRPPLYPDALRTLTDPVLSEIVGDYDQTAGAPENCGAHNWTRLDERMNYIVNLFRVGQQDKKLYRALPDADLRTLQLDLSDEHLNDLRQIGDNDIDRRIADHMNATRKHPRHFLQDLVAGGFADLLAAVPYAPPLPEWAKAERLANGQNFFRRYGLEIGSALFSASLPMSYTAARGARVLTTTAALVSDARRRLAETGEMLLDAMASDDSSKPPLGADTRAYQAARGVRLFHGAVRHMIRTDPVVNWHEQRVGVPINQEDLLGTLTVFTVAVIESLDQMGVTCEVQDRDDYFHLWLVIGELLGLDYKRFFRQGAEPRDDEQPLSYADMQLVARVILGRNAAASPEGRELMTSLLKVSEGSMPPLLKGLPRALTRHLIGDQYAHMLGIPRSGVLRLVIAALQPFNALISPHMRTNPLGGLTTSLTRRLYRFWIDEGHGDRPPWRFEENRPSWLAPARTRARSLAGKAVMKTPVVPLPAKQRISAFVSPGPASA
jgi:ER-bound oxygenase mpaB/B'/Rubber oxygenase, catalytic domain